MKAIIQARYGEADVLRFEEVETPVPGDDQVLIQVKAVGIDAGVWHVMAGVPYLVRPMFGWQRPKNPIRGSEFSGVVTTVGRGVSDFKVGDEVYGVATAALAEYAVASVKSIAPKPTGLSWVEAAAVPISATTALQALRDSGQLKAGERVLVIGAGGGVGTFAVQIAKHHGANVTAVCSTSKVELVRSLGADRVIDYTAQEGNQIDRTFDLIVDTAGNRPLHVLRRLLEKDGRLILIGGETRGRMVGALARSLRAALLNPFVGQKMTMMLARDNRADLMVLKDMIEVGQLKPVIDRTYPLIESAEAVRYQRRGHSAGKTVVTI